ncbi:MAG: hypothetical protein ACR2RB_17355 [Gammaproteobacteria bacterium]
MSDRRTLTLRRGPEHMPEHMIVFQGCPDASTVSALHQIGLMVGVALASDELRSATSIGVFDYLFVHRNKDSTAALICALNDLSLSNWVIEQKPSELCYSDSHTASEQLRNKALA